MAKGNVLVMQSGGSTPVLNRSLVGVASEAEDSGAFGTILGARHAIDGVLAGHLVDLGLRGKTWWQRVARTPGGVLGSSRRLIRDEDVPAILRALSDNRIRYWFTIGGNDSAEIAHRVAIEARAAGRDLTVINVPKTIDNDLVLTDHAPGYGSAARFVALATMGAGRDAETMGAVSPITVIEVMGRDAGWLTASAALAKREERDAPHLVCVPEVPIDEDRFLNGIEEAYGRFGFAVAVVGENARGPSGPLGGQREPYHVDDFGHAYFEGPGRRLADLAAERLGVRVRSEKPGTIQRSLAACISSTDATEAEMVGRAAVRYALDGATDKMVTLVRERGEEYSCTTGLAPLEEVAGKVRSMPAGYLDPANHGVTADFLRYARPLIGAPLPRFARLSE